MSSANPLRVLMIDDEVNTLRASATVLKMNGLPDVMTESDSRRVLEIMDSGPTPPHELVTQGIAASLLGMTRQTLNNRLKITARIETRGES